VYSRKILHHKMLKQKDRVIYQIFYLKNVIDYFILKFLTSQIRLTNCISVIAILVHLVWCSVYTTNSQEIKCSKRCHL